MKYYIKLILSLQSVVRTDLLQWGKPLRWWSRWRTFGWRESWVSVPRGWTAAQRGQCWGHPDPEPPPAWMGSLRDRGGAVTNVAFSMTDKLSPHLLSQFIQKRIEHGLYQSGCTTPKTYKHSMYEGFFYIYLNACLAQKTTWHNNIVNHYQIVWELVSQLF